MIEIYSMHTLEVLGPVMARTKNGAAFLPPLFFSLITQAGGALANLRCIW